MLDRQKIEAIPARRFPGATRPQIAAAATAIMGMDDEWQDLAGRLARVLMAVLLVFIW